MSKEVGAGGRFDIFLDSAIDTDPIQSSADVKRGFLLRTGNHCI